MERNPSIRCTLRSPSTAATNGRRKRGTLIGGRVGQALIEDADAWMTAREIRDPARLAAAFVPW